MRLLALAGRRSEEAPGVAEKMRLDVHLRLTGPRHDLGPVADGATAEGRVGFCIDADGRTDEAKLELRVESGDGRTFAVLPVVTKIA